MAKVGSKFGIDVTGNTKGEENCSRRREERPPSDGVRMKHMQYGLFQSTSDDGTVRFEIWPLPSSVTADEYAKRINATLVSLFSYRQDAEAAKAREDKNEGASRPAPAH